jgi:hypothetical protein
MIASWRKQDIARFDRWSTREMAVSRELIAGSVMRGFEQLPEKWKSKSARSRTT